MAKHAAIWKMGPSLVPRNQVAGIVDIEERAVKVSGIAEDVDAVVQSLFNHGLNRPIVEDAPSAGLQRWRWDTSRGNVRRSP